MLFTTIKIHNFFLNPFLSLLTYVIITNCIMVYNGHWICSNIIIFSFSSPHIRDTWNCLDLVTLLVYICTFLLRMATWSSSEPVVNNRSLVVAGYLYGLNTMILTFRVFGQVMETVKGLGTIQIALFSIIRDVATIFWQFVATVIAFSFAITKVYMSEKSFITEKEYDIYP